MKRLRPVVKECREVLEKEILAHVPSNRFAEMNEAGIDAYVQDTATALLIELALMRCLEVRSRITRSMFSTSLSWEALQAACLRQRRVFQGELPFPLQWADLSELTLSDHALATLSHHLLYSLFLDDWSSDHILGWLYENFQADTADQKQHGRFYTPEIVTSAIVEQVLELSSRPWSTNNSGGKLFPTILDLGCGCGAFTLQAFDRLFHDFQAQGDQVDNLAGHILSQHLFLIDNDPWACQVAALGLYLKARRLEPSCRMTRLNLICADALQRWEETNASKYDSLKKIFTSKYDFVIGNPPYSVIKQLRAPKELLQLYKSYRTAAYKINTFPLFMERGIDVLQPHGVLGMVVPNTVLTQLYFGPLRRYILETCTIRRILDTKRLFDTAFVENCIVVLQREADASARSAHRVECQTGQWRMADNGKVGIAIHHIGQRHFERAPGMVFQVHCNDAVCDLLEYIRRDAPTLADICESHDGVNPGNAKRKLIVSKNVDATCKKVLNGKNIARYRLHWDGLYVRYDRSLLSRGDNVRWGHPEALEGAKILTRQTADRIIGTFDAGEFYVTNSVHTTVLRDGITEVLLKYVLAVLNSRLLSFYYRKLFPEVGQVFSQVKLVNFRQLPLKLISSHEQQDIIALVEQLLESAPHSAFSKPSGACTMALAQHRIDHYEQQLCKVQELDERLDSLVYAAYKLSPEQIQEVEREAGGRVTQFPKVEIGELGRRVSYEEFWDRYCRQSQSIFTIAAEYQVHPASVARLRQEYGVYREEEIQHLRSPDISRRNGNFVKTQKNS